MNDYLARPFRALRPSCDTAAQIVAPPYDVVSSEEARLLADGRPDSFLRISRPEIDFPPGTDPHADEVYARGAANFQRLRDSGLLLQDEDESFYVYRMSVDGHVQTGIALSASVAAYDQNRIRKHERTRPDKEDDRVRNIESLGAQTGPVLCAYSSSERMRDLLKAHTMQPPLVEVEGPNLVTHSIWKISSPGRVDELAATINAMSALYIADGHHRSAAASRVAEARRQRGEPLGNAESFLCVAFPHNEMKIFDYNRAVKDLNGLSEAELLSSIRQRFDVEPLDQGQKPDRAGRFSMYLNARWYRLEIHADRLLDDPVAGLDVSILQTNLLRPLLGIEDPRTDERIEFIGGIRGLEGLKRRVDAGDAAVAFALFPTAMEQLMAVADAEKLMPPKSTWFEPKLADGLLSQLLD